MTWTQRDRDRELLKLLERLVKPAHRALDTSDEHAARSGDKGWVADLRALRTLVNLATPDNLDGIRRNMNLKPNPIITQQSYDAAFARSPTKSITDIAHRHIPRVSGPAIRKFRERNPQK